MLDRAPIKESIKMHLKIAHGPLLQNGLYRKGSTPLPPPKFL